MTEDNVNEMAKELFTTDRDEMLRQQLPRMEGWFDVTGGSITFLLDLEEFTKGEKYLYYLLGAFVASIAGERETKFVENSEVDDRFGWNNGRSSAQYASDYSELLASGEDGKAIADHSLETAIDELAGSVDE